MSILTFNGAAELRCSDGIVVSGRSEPGNTIFLRAANDRGELWQAGPFFIGPDPRLRFAGPDSVDVVATYWEAVSAAVVLGDSAAYVIDEKTGDVRAVFSMIFIGRASLDIAAIAEVKGGGMLLLVSTKKALLVNARLHISGSFEPAVMLVAPPLVGESTITFYEYDIENNGQRIEEIISVP